MRKIHLMSKKGTISSNSVLLIKSQIKSKFPSRCSSNSIATTIVTISLYQSHHNILLNHLLLLLSIHLNLQNDDQSINNATNRLFFTLYIEMYTFFKKKHKFISNIPIKYLKYLVICCFLLSYKYKYIALIYC